MEKATPKMTSMIPDGSHLPYVKQDAATLDQVAAHTPILYRDASEPFDLVAVGYTVIDAPGPSPSFDRRIDWVEAGYPAVKAIEYELWWDWDIQHLYELEHAWCFLGAAGNVVAAEASWHGYYLPIGSGDSLKLEAGHPVVYVQAGKHAMVPVADGFDQMREDATASTSEQAGSQGLLETPLFAGQLGKSPEADARVTKYLKSLAFTPTFNFSRRSEIPREILLPWETLRDWIPARVKWCLEQI